MLDYFLIFFLFPWNTKVVNNQHFFPLILTEMNKVTLKTFNLIRWPASLGDEQQKTPGQFRHGRSVALRWRLKEHIEKSRAGFTCVRPTEWSLNVDAAAQFKTWPLCRYHEPVKATIYMVWLSVHHILYRTKQSTYNRISLCWNIIHISIDLVCTVFIHVCGPPEV